MGKADLTLVYVFTPGGLNRTLDTEKGDSGSAFTVYLKNKTETAEKARRHVAIGEECIYQSLLSYTLQSNKIFPVYPV